MSAPEETPVQRDGYVIDPGVDIGHVHLKVADIDRALDFYCGVLGFELMQRYGDQAAFVSAGGYHHHIGLNTWESRGGTPPPPGHTGLFHAAIRYPTRKALATALLRLAEAGIPLSGASDHGVSRGALPARPRRQRPGAVLGPAARGVARRPHRERPGEHVHRAPRHRRPAASGRPAVRNYAGGCGVQRTVKRLLHGGAVLAAIGLGLLAGGCALSSWAKPANALHRRRGLAV